jgi:hypothetical protein
MDGSGKDSPGRKEPISGTRSARPLFRAPLVAQPYGALPRPGPKTPVLSRLIDVRRRSARRWTGAWRYPQLSALNHASRPGEFSTHSSTSMALPL